MELDFLDTDILPFEINRAAQLSEGERAYRLKQVKDLRAEIKLTEALESSNWIAPYKNHIKQFDCPPPHCNTRRDFIQAVLQQYATTFQWYHFGRPIFRKYENVSDLIIHRIVKIS